ncbi:nitrous oxide-stimulated promoter family protein [Proteiniphilum sp. UBA5384]|uniref:nitrous oxide-stimulated promoter family protein n=1 Tax=Proteiniphilum sp. UBA5384 TaxID=1947279 RepID=UPI0025E86662|nr:nitrous oxide-stimulated promoter family protein [Proteiniphilum sp. UBA5384]
MIFLYCRSKHGSVKELCIECGALERYALQRLEKCRYGEDKPTCATCPVHCYRSDMRMKIKEVMRFSGPRMMFFHPLDTIRHYCQEIRRNRNYAAKNRINNKNS